MATVVKRVREMGGLLPEDEACWGIVPHQDLVCHEMQSFVHAMRRCQTQ
jgi:hypothetical protein